MANDLLVRDILDLPPEVPECVVNIRQFDDPDVLAENIRDYVITARVAEELEEFVSRLHRTVEWNQGGRGHFVHGSFGSGKSHFMAILGLILENHPKVWEKAHPTIQKLRAEFSEWLASHPVLVIPVYMLGQESFQQAMYRSANERLRQLGQPLCEFSEAHKVVQRFLADAQSFGDSVWQDFFAKSRTKSRKAFERKQQGGQEQLDELAAEILAWRGDLAEAEKRHLYPDSFIDGVLKLTRHAQDLGYAAIVFFVDELILYLSGKSGQDWVQDLNDLGALVDPAHRADQAVPLWVVVAKQRDIRETVPEDNSRQPIYDHLDWQKDRFSRTTELTDVELIPITEERLLKCKPGQDQFLRQAVSEAIEKLSPQVRQTLMHDFDLEDFQRVYPFHPALIRTLIDVSNRLSKERAGIRLLYELLIERYPELPIGRFIPYAALFDVIFLQEGLVGGATNPELEAVRRMYYERIMPVIQELYNNGTRSAQNNNGALRPLTSAEKLETVVKTVLLCQLSPTMRDHITVERILHLNYADLLGMTPLGTYNQISDMLKRLANRSDVVRFSENSTDPAKGTISISVEAAPDIRSILKTVPATEKMRLNAFVELMRRSQLLSHAIKEGELSGYNRLWRGTRRSGRVAFKNVRELSAAAMSLSGEYTIFIDYPWDPQPGHGTQEDRAAIEKGRSTIGPQPVGFWLPGYLSTEDLKDLDEYAKILELDDNTDSYLSDLGRSAREAVESKMPAFKQAKERTLLSRLEECYLHEGQVLFLDPSIGVHLDVQNLREGLDHIVDAALDRLYPHHPRFKGEIDSRSLQRLLTEFLIPASQPGASIKRTKDLDDLLERLGQPLELVRRGATAWVLEKTSKYLRKLEELAAGSQVKADDVRLGLERAFGFNRDLCDLFILYLVKAQGYRVLRNGRAVDAAQIDFGKLAGVTLERGQLLQLSEWSQVKNLARFWNVQIPVADLSVSAQDQLWDAWHTQAHAVAQRLSQIDTRLQELLKQTEAEVQDSHRWRALQAARDLNNLAARRNVDSYTGLKGLLEWTSQSDIEMRDVTETIAGREEIHRNLAIDLPSDNVELVIELARSQDSDRAIELREQLRRLLCAANRELDLTVNILAWQRDAAEFIRDRVMGRAEVRTEVIEESPSDDPRTREKPTEYVVANTILEIGGIPVEIDATPLTKAVFAVLGNFGESSLQQQEIEVNLRMRVIRKQRE